MNRTIEAGELRPTDLTARFKWVLDGAAPNQDLFHVRRDMMEAVVKLRAERDTLQVMLDRLENTQDV